MSSVIRRSEVIDWWDSERLRVRNECEQTRGAIFVRLEEAFAELSSSDLLLPKSEAYHAIEQRVGSDLKTLSKRLSRTIERSVTASVRLAEGEGASLSDHTGFVLAGAAAAGSVGLAAAAASLATSTATFLLVIPVTTISWPAFAAAGAGALALAYVSPTAASWTIEKIRRQYLSSIKRQVEYSLFGNSTAADDTGICTGYLAQLDRLRDLRLETIKIEFEQ